MTRKLPLLILPFVAIAALSLAVACGDDGDDEGNSGATATQPAATQAAITPEQAFAEACVKSDEKQWETPPPRIIDTVKTYVATISTDKGDMVVELYSDTPVTTNNFVFLACKGFYDGLTFHRVEPDFVIQGGDPTGSGSGGPGYVIEDEDDPGHPMVEGVISMAKSGPDTTGSQFFITIGLGTEGDLSYLDPDFTVFGEVTSGMDVAEQVIVGDVMNSVTIAEQ